MLHLFKRTGMLGLLMSFLLMTACSTTPEVQQYSDSADPSQEIDTLESNLGKATADQVNVLSPDNYKKANKYLKEAKEARNDNDSNKKVLKEVALGNAWLMKANEVARRGSDAIPNIVDIRARALEAKAPTYAKKSWAEAEEDLIDLGEDFEDNDFTISNEVRQNLLSQYMDVELIAIKGEYLGTAGANIKQAEKEGAKKVAPQTLSLAQKRFKDAESYITANRQNVAEITKISNQAQLESERVLNITRNAKTNKNKTPEQLALAMEAEETAQRELAQDLSASRSDLSASQSDLANSQTKLDEKDSAIAVMSAETSELSDKVALDEKYKTAKSQFKSSEAEVLKDGDKLVIRLKGLQFPSGQADLKASSYPLMTKVQTVIKSFGDTDVEVEGHTDAIGAKEINTRLSEERADAVKNYLVENGAIASANVTAAGYGDEKPITTNKTKEGRAQNRRVDIIVTPQ